MADPRRASRPPSATAAGCRQPPPAGIPANVMPGDGGDALAAPPHGGAPSYRRAGGQPAAAVNAGPGGAGQDAELDRLRRQYPQWRIWRGHATGDYWALPLRDYPAVRELIGARDIDQLARRLAQAERRHDL